MNYNTILKSFKINYNSHFPVEHSMDNIYFNDNVALISFLMPEDQIFLQ